MIKVACVSCSAPYELDERRLPGSGLRMRCPKCGTSFQVFADGRVEAAASNALLEGSSPKPPSPPRMPAPSFDDDLPAPRALGTQRPDLGIDLPAPAAAKPATPKKPIAPPLAAPTSTASSPFADLDLDLPAKRPAPNKSAPLTPSFDDLDLPAPANRFEDRPTGAKPAPRAAAKAPLAPPLPAASKKAESPRVDLDDDLGLDLPSPRTPGRAASLPARAKHDNDFDLPAPRSLSPQKASPLPAPLDLPSPRATASASLDAPSALADVSRNPFDDEFDFGSPQVATGAALPDLDLPVAKNQRSTNGGFGEIDLPSPRSLDLPSLRPDRPSPRGEPGRAADLRAPLSIDLPSPPRDLDLPMPRQALATSGFPSDGRAPEGSKGAAAMFGDLDLPSPGRSLPTPPSLDDGRDDDLELPLPPSAHVPPATSGRGHGEIDLGSGPADDMEFADIPQAEPSEAPPPAARPALALDGPVAPSKPRPPRATPKKSRAPVIVAGTLVVLVLAGAALSWTPMGPFGLYAVEPYLPAAGNAQEIRTLLERADAQILSSTYSEALVALRSLAEARRDAGLNRELLARSLVHESLFQFRYGDSAGSSGRAATLYERLIARGEEDPAIALALAANALRTGNTDRIAELAARARSAAPQDALVEWVAGEAALAQGNREEARSTFEHAKEKGGGAAAEWGLVRVHIIAGSSDADIDRAIARTLEASPRHVGARIVKAKRAARAGDETTATQLLREALGLEPVDGTPLSAASGDRVDAWVALAEVHEQRGRIRSAFEAYEAAVALDARNVPALLGSGRTILSDRPSDALARFDAVTQLPTSADAVTSTSRSARQEAQLGAARAKVALGRLEEARSELEALFAQRAEDAEVALALGSVEARLEHRDVAEALFREAVRLAPTEFDGYLALARAYVAEGRAEEAAAVLDQARAAVAESASMREALGTFELGRNRLEAAIREFERAVTLDPELPAATFGLGVALRRSGHLDRAEAEFDRLARIDPGHPGLSLERGLLYEARGQSERAVRFYSDALREQPDDGELLLRLGAAEVAAGQIDSAATHLQAAQRALPGSAEVEHFVGRVSFARGQLPEAASHFERAISLDATRGEFYLHAAWAQIELGNIGRALERAEEAIRRDPSLGDAYWIRGRVHLRAGAVRDALSDFNRALELRPARVEALADMGEAHDQLRQLPAAIADYERALAAKDDRGQWWYRLGRLRLDVAQRAEAARALARATLLGEAETPKPHWLADAHRLAGDAMRMGGERSSAIEHYQRYLELAPESAIDRQDVRGQLMDLGAVPQNR